MRLATTSCHYCPLSSYTTGTYGGKRKIDVPGGLWVHFGCLRHWLADYAITHTFPGIDPRERRVLKARLRIPEAIAPRLADLESIGAQHGWNGSVRASQVQQAAMSKFRPTRTDAAESDAAKWAAAQPVLAKAQKLVDEVDGLLSGLAGKTDVPEG